MTRARRLALLDLGWEDADAIIRGLRRPDVEVGLVLGVADDAPGLRVARMLGVPHSTDLVDLTRELFDVAVIGAGSQRRAALERLLESLGAAIESPIESHWAPALKPHGPNGSEPGHAGGEASWLDAFGEEPAPMRPAPSGAGEPLDVLAAGARRVDHVELSRRAAWAVERHRVEGTRATLHRVTLAEASDEHAAGLAACFRATDTVCRIDARRWVLLCSGLPAPSASIERRLRDVLGATSAPVRDERVALTSETDTAAFVNAARDWLRPSESAEPGLAHDR